MQQHRLTVWAGDTALQNTGVLKGEKAVDQHLRAAIEPNREGGQLGPFRKGRAKLVEKGTKVRIPRVTQHERVRQRIRERADPDLKGTSVLNQGSGIEGHGVVGEGDCLDRKR